METIDFGCHVRFLHRRRLEAGSLPASLNAVEFLATVKKESLNSGSRNWTRLRLSHAGGLRMTKSAGGLHPHCRKDEGFESDSQDSAADSDPPLNPSAGSGGSSGVNSSSSDMDENETSLSSSSGRNYPSCLSTLPIRTSLSDILSCQNPAALPRVVLMTLRSGDALDIVALECSADETARILTHLCQKLCSSSSSAEAKNAEASARPKVSIQSWAQRRPPKSIRNDPAEETRETIRKKLESQTWNLIQRTDTCGLTHLQVSSQKPNSAGSNSGGSKKKQSGSKNSDLVNQSGSQRSSTSGIHPLGMKGGKGKNKSGSGSSDEQSISGSCIVSLQTPELPLPLESPPPSGSSRWIFGVTPRLPSGQSNSARSRGRSVERKKPSRLDRNLNDELEAVLQSQLADRNPPNLPLPPLPPTAPLPTPPEANPPVKAKRDQSKTRSFLMKFTGSAQSGSKSAPSVPAEVESAHPAPAAVKKERGRSLLRLRSGTSGRTPSQGPPLPAANPPQPQTFLIPTKSGHELSRNIYPKETPYAQHPHQQLYHPQFQMAGRPIRQPTGYPPGYSPIQPQWYWADPSDPNNNHHHQMAAANPHWVYFHPGSPIQHPHQQQQQQPQPMTKQEFMRMRSRSQSPGRRWLPATPAGPPLHLYEAVGSYQPVSLPVTPMTPMVTSPDLHDTGNGSNGGGGNGRSRSRSGRTPSGFHRSFYRKKRNDPPDQVESDGSTSDHLRKVTFNAFATVQLVDSFVH